MMPLNSLVTVSTRLGCIHEPYDRNDLYYGEDKLCLAVPSDPKHVDADNEGVEYGDPGRRRDIRLPISNCNRSRDDLKR